MKTERKGHRRQPCFISPDDLAKINSPEIDLPLSIPESSYGQTQKRPQKSIDFVSCALREWQKKVTSPLDTIQETPEEDDISQKTYTSPR